MLIYLSYCGLFTKIEIKEKEAGGYMLVYEEFKGDYKNSSKIMDKVYYSLINDYNIETTNGFGIYYDNPKEVDKDDLRSDLGCIITEKDYDNVEEIKKNFLVKEWPKKKCIYVEFPFKGFMSVILGIKKVYPRINEYVKDKSYQGAPIMEIYDVPNKKIIYLMPVK